jgi:transglutaminase-like putative cysteine protease
MHYTVRHVTRFTYDSPICESVMEARMQPRSELCQRCVRFELSTTPAAQVLAYADSTGNLVHHFDIAGWHTRLTIIAEAIVEFVNCPEAPDRLRHEAWDAVDAAAQAGEHWDWLQPSAFTADSALLQAFIDSLALDRRADPLTTVRGISTAIRERFNYSPQATRVDSPIDEALRHREGVCQDFAHIMIGVVRGLGIPCRYVSGYLFHGDTDRSPEGATHAWVEACLPQIGWVGIDPTNDLLAGDRHIRVAIGRDYADVPPTRGVYKGEAASELSVSVQVSKAELPPSPADFLPVTTWTSPEPASADPGQGQQQQQQQQ